MTLLTTLCSALVLATPPEVREAAPAWLCPPTSTSGVLLAQDHRDSPRAFAVLIPAAGHAFDVGPLLVSPVCGAADSACRESALAHAHLAEATLSLPSLKQETAGATLPCVLLRDRRPALPRHRVADEAPWSTDVVTACPIVGSRETEAVASAAPASDCPTAPAPDLELAAQLHQLGVALLTEARAAAAAELTDDAKKALVLRATAVPALAPSEAIAFAGWCKAVDGAQCVLRAAGDLQGAALRVQDLTDLLERIGAAREASVFRSRANTSDVGIASFSEHEYFPLECWRLGEAVVRARVERARLLASVLEDALRIARAAGLAPEALKELELRFGQCEAWLPLGMRLDARARDDIRAQLKERLTKSEEAQWDVMQTRETTWEAYAAMWNLSDALPASLMQERASQRAGYRDFFHSTAIEPLGPIDPSFLASLDDALSELINSPFQPPLLFPTTGAGIKAFRRELLMYTEGGLEDDLKWTAELRAEIDPALRAWLWRLHTENWITIMASCTVGELALQCGMGPDVASYRNPFGADCSPAYCNTGGSPYASLLRRRW